MIGLRSRGVERVSHAAYALVALRSRDHRDGAAGARRRSRRLVPARIEHDHQPPPAARAGTASMSAARSAASVSGADFSQRRAERLARPAPRIRTVPSVTRRLARRSARPTLDRDAFRRLRRLQRAMGRRGRRHRGELQPHRSRRWPSTELASAAASRRLTRSSPTSAAGTATARITDYGTLRVRGGWAAGMLHALRDVRPRDRPRRHHPHGARSRRARPPTAGRRSLVPPTFTVTEKPSRARSPMATRPASASTSA